MVNLNKCDRHADKRCSSSSAVDERNTYRVEIETESSKIY